MYFLNLELPFLYSYVSNLYVFIRLRSLICECHSTIYTLLFKYFSYIILHLCSPNIDILHKCTVLPHLDTACHKWIRDVRSYSLRKLPFQFSLCFPIGQLFLLTRTFNFIMQLHILQVPLLSLNRSHSLQMFNRR